MTSAAFFIGLGESATCLGTVARDGSAADMDNRYLFGPSQSGKDGYTEDTFRHIAGESMRAVGALEPDQHPDMIYVFKNGSVLVYERGFTEDDGPGYFQVALHYPNGARRPVQFQVA